MKRIKVTGDGTASGTKVVVLDDDNNPVSDITEEIKSLQITQNAGGIPMLTLVVLAPQIDLTTTYETGVAYTHTNKDDHGMHYPQDPRVGEVRYF